MNSSLLNLCLEFQTSCCLRITEYQLIPAAIEKLYVIGIFMLLKCLTGCSQRDASADTGYWTKSDNTVLKICIIYFNLERLFYIPNLIQQSLGG